MKINSSGSSPTRGENGGQPRGTGETSIKKASEKMTAIRDSESGSAVKANEPPTIMSIERESGCIKSAEGGSMRQARIFWRSGRLGLAEFLRRIKEEYRKTDGGAWIGGRALSSAGSSPQRGEERFERTLAR